jgi:hypothetical protein
MANQVWDPSIAGGAGGWVTPTTQGTQGAQFAPGVGYYLPPGVTPNAAPAPTPQGSPNPGLSLYVQPPLTQTMAPTRGNANYNPPEINALKQIQKISPATYNLMNNTATKMGGQVENAQANYNTVQGLFNNAISGQLPTGVQRDVTQQVAGNEAATGNTQGVAQAVEQGMTTGEAGLGYQNQELQNLDSQGGYLSNVLNQAQGYLTSGASPYGMGSTYVDRAIAQANPSGAPTYQSTTPTVNPYSYINPNAGTNFAQGETGMLNAGVGATPGSPSSAGLIGAGIGAAGSATSALISSGALAGLGSALAAF